MKIIVDSGSTQSSWLFVDGGEVRIFRTRGINALQHTAGQIAATLATLPPCSAVERIDFYGAGGGPTFPEATARLTEALAAHFGADPTRIDVESDLAAAARALYGRGEGIACILGTGSNTCHVRDGNIAGSVPPLGYILGDEGSGSALGRRLLNGVFKGHISLREELTAACGMTYEQIIRRVYNEPFANRFLASFAPFVAAHAELPSVRRMILDCFAEFAERNLSRYPVGLPVSLVGGVASHFETLLREAVRQAGRVVDTVVASPAEGLLKYHCGDTKYMFIDGK